MKLFRRTNSYYIKKRVPRRFEAIETREAVWISLKTDSESTARLTAPTIWGQMLEAWQAKLDGADAEGEEIIEAAKTLAEKRGYRFMHARDVAKLPLREVLERVEKVKNSRGKIDLLEAEALLGGAEEGDVSVSKALEAYWKLAAPKAAGKNTDQIRRWQNPRKKAVANFIKVIGDKPIQQITTPDLFEFRAWWWDRIEDQGLTPNSANKDFIHLTAMLKIVARAKDIPLAFSTEGLAIDEGKKNTRPPFSVDWIRDKILAPGALDGLNLEARCIVLGMVNTGARPSELEGLLPHHIVLDAPVPHIAIKPEGRKLKTVHSERVIPLTGVSLAAFQECPDGFPRYRGKAWLSDTVNKYFRERGLMETPRHSLYGLRHSFEDRMLEAGVDERIRRDLFGHRLNRERYGRGADLAFLRSLIEKFAL